MTVCCLVRVVALQTHPVDVGPDLDELSEESIEDANIKGDCKQEGDDVNTS